MILFVLLSLSSHQSISIIFTDPVVTLMPGQELNVAFLMEERKKRCDKDINAPPFDDLRNFTYEGSGSIAESLSSLASGRL